VRTINGLHSLPDRADSTSPKVGRLGENLFPTEPARQDRHLQRRDPGQQHRDLRALRTAMLAAFADTTTYGTMDLISQYEPVYPGRQQPDRPVLRTGPAARDPGGADQQPLHPRVPARPAPDRPAHLLPRLWLSTRPSIYPLSCDEPRQRPVDPVIHIAAASGTVTVSDGTHTLTFRNCPSGTLDIDFRSAPPRSAATPSSSSPPLDWWDSHVPGIAGGATVTITQTGGTSVRVTFVPACGARRGQRPGVARHRPLAPGRHDLSDLPYYGRIADPLDGDVTIPLNDSPPREVTLPDPRPGTAACHKHSNPYARCLKAYYHDQLVFWGPMQAHQRSTWPPARSSHRVDPSIRLIHHFLRRGDLGYTAR
jgi:hypothetical protein